MICLGRRRGRTKRNAVALRPSYRNPSVPGWCLLVFFSFPLGRSTANGLPFFSFAGPPDAEMLGYWTGYAAVRNS